MPRLSIVVPTFNEENNVGRLAAALKDSLAGVDYEIVFVDDSTDNTPTAINALAKVHPHIRLVHRRGEERAGGLSTAVVRGFEEAQGEYLCVMDADLQHPPAMARKLFEEALMTGADIVIGSRYLKGGAYDGLDGPFRKLMSVACKEFVRGVYFPRLKGVTDPLSGLFLVHRQALEGVALRPKGFKILLEILIRCNWETAREVPYEFMARTDGESKANAKQGLTFLRHVAALFWVVPSAGRLWKFATVGLSGIAINFAILLSLVQAGLMEPAAWVIAIETSVVSNYFLNQLFTFRDRPIHRLAQLGRRLVDFNVASWTAIVVNGTILFSLRGLGVSLIVAQTAAVGAVAAINYMASTRWVFQSEPRLANA